MLALYAAVTEGNEVDIKVVSEEAAEDFTYPACRYIEARASLTTHSYLDKLTAAVRKSLGIVQIDSPPSSNHSFGCRDLQNP